MFSCEFCETFKNMFSYRTIPVAVSDCDWFYQSSFWRLHVPRMYTNLNMNVNNKNRVRQERDTWSEEMFNLKNSIFKRILD